MLEVHHIGILVQDLNRSGRFYSQIMGFEKGYEHQIPAEIIGHIFGQNTACRVAVYRRDDVTLELFQPDRKITVRRQDSLQPGVNHFGLKVADMTTFYLGAKAKGAQVIEVPRGDHCVYFIRDPDGVLIEIKEK